MQDNKSHECRIFKHHSIANNIFLDKFQVEYLCTFHSGLFVNHEIIDQNRQDAKKKLKSK